MKLFVLFFSLFSCHILLAQLDSVSNPIMHYEFQGNAKNLVSEKYNGEIGFNASLVSGKIESESAYAFLKYGQASIIIEDSLIIENEFSVSIDVIKYRGNNTFPDILFSSYSRLIPHDGNIDYGIEGFDFYITERSHLAGYSFPICKFYSNNKSLNNVDTEEITFEEIEIPLNDWHNIIFSVSEDSVSIYLNGEFKGRKKRQLKFDGFNLYTSVFAKYGFYGAVDRMLFYGRLLEKNELRNIANGNDIVLANTGEAELKTVLYPNPSDNALNIEGVVLDRVIVINSKGIQIPLSYNSGKVDLMTIDSGLYHFIGYKNGQIVINESFIKN